ncbi:hypothetical protein PHLGIDRAFT_16514 [Phlebiopsis gigantea 11061_1 CR5-6]|uniref:Uncharacterized protein n=1 Tax=Phlebiopsis gigantea (strain 11061_1 CR5-6) TaxID=745531 RepID=A0A0C3S0H9_PHLG1|nr:hypothetical protein PHLGIDRAFT_16514 [Phlebiopsis gigantea 11061_1 CR5-6]
MARMEVDNGKSSVANKHFKRMSNFARNRSKRLRSYCATGIITNDFGPTKGGHLAPSDLKLDIGFPPGSLISHFAAGNIPLRPGETRTSWTRCGARTAVVGLDAGYAAIPTTETLQDRAQGILLGRKMLYVYARNFGGGIAYSDDNAPAQFRAKQRRPFCVHPESYHAQMSVRLRPSFYVTGYAAKKQGKNYNLSALMADGYTYHVDHPHPEYTNNLRRKQSLLLSLLVNTVNREQELSAPMVMSYLMGWGDVYRSHGEEALAIFSTTARPSQAAGPGI